MPKNSPIQLSVIVDILTLTKEKNNQFAIHKKLGVSRHSIKKYLDRYQIDIDTRPEVIDSTIDQLYRDEENGIEEIDYDKQQSCLHPLLFVKCPICKITLSEKDRDKIIAIVSKYEPHIEKIRIEQMI